MLCDDGTTLRSRRRSGWTRYATILHADLDAFYASVEQLPSVELGLRVGLGGVELRLQFLDFRSGLLLLVLGSSLGLVSLGGGEHLLCDRERGIGASLGQFKLAQRRRE